MTLAIGIAIGAVVTLVLGTLWLSHLLSGMFNF